MVESKIVVIRDSFPSASEVANRSRPAENIRAEENLNFGDAPNPWDDFRLLLGSGLRGKCLVHVYTGMAFSRGRGLFTFHHSVSTTSRSFFASLAARGRRSTKRSSTCGLLSSSYSRVSNEFGGRDRVRTCDPLLAKRQTRLHPLFLSLRLLMFPTNRGICFRSKANPSRLKTTVVHSSCTVEFNQKSYRVNPSSRQRCAFTPYFEGYCSTRESALASKNVIIAAAVDGNFLKENPNRASVMVQLGLDSCLLRLT